MCFIDQLKWPADANVTLNILVTVLNIIKQKVRLYDFCISILLVMRSSTEMHIIE